MTRQDSAKGKIIGAIIVVVIVTVAAWWYFTRMPGVDFSRQGPEPSGPARANSVAPAEIAHPIERAQTLPAIASTAPLPPLAASDDALIDTLAKLPGAEGLAKLLVAPGLIPHIVATVDALPRSTIGSSILPLRTPAGAFAANTSGAQPVLDANDFSRYAPYMKIVAAADPRTLVTWYVHWYPLFQQAYRQLGYPKGYFNDRLLVAINDMLAAPNARAPIALLALPNGRYGFADPTWETLSVGQKLMIRIGPENERMLKEKLRTIRALLLGKAPQLREVRAMPAAAGSSG